MSSKWLLLFQLLIASTAFANEKRVGVLTVVDRNHEFSSQQCLNGAGELVEKSDRVFKKTPRALFGYGAQASWYCHTPKLTSDPRYEGAEKVVGLPRKEVKEVGAILTENSGIGKILCYGSSSFEQGQLVTGVVIHHDRREGRFPNGDYMEGVKDYGDLSYLQKEIGEEKFSKQIEDFLTRCARQHFEAVEKDEKSRIERRLVIDKGL
jgi:hypothetical protein